MAERRILLCMSGSIACAKATGLVTEWRRRGHQVRVAMSPGAARFVGRATLEGLSGHAVFDDAFAAGQAMDHIAWSQWADWLVVCPASANTINRLAAGIADEPVGLLWQAAWGRGVLPVIVPAMNTHMWQYPATREAVARLGGWGVHVLPTADGELACGEQGEGRMLEVADIIERIEAVATAQPPRTRHPRRILVTGGGTREPLDAVRWIGNRSTGGTAASLAEHLHAVGHRVTWLGAQDAIRPRGGLHAETFGSFAELDAQLRRLLAGGAFELVIHAAAVSDFSPRGGDPASKLPSGEPLVLRLEPNPKLVGRLREYAHDPGLRVVAFKLTANAGPAAAQAAVQRLFEAAGADAVVHNDLADIGATRHAFTLYPAGGPGRRIEGHAALACAIASFVEGKA